MTYIYTRPTLASPPDPDEQEGRARLAAERAGFSVSAVWRESSLTPRQRRAGLPCRATMLARATSGTVLIVSDAAVLGRGLADLIAVLAAAQVRGVTILLAQDDGSLRQVSACDLDEARRRYARECVQEGRARAKARGVRFGRPPVPERKVVLVRDALAQGLGLRAAARAGGVGVATAARIRAAALAKNAFAG